MQRRDKFEDKGLDPELYFDYDAAMQDEQEISECTYVESAHPLYILCMNLHQDLISLYRYIRNDRST